jgi:hypothetical protein
MVRAKRSAKKDPSYRTLKADYYPVQRQVNLAATADPGSNPLVLDVARNLSVVNHRLYRQGKTYQVKIDLNNRGAAVAASQFDVFVLCDTWYVQKAWQLARARYLMNTSDERAVMSEQQVARWEDFRVSAGVSGAGTIVPYRYLPTLAGSTDTSGEFELSQITMADGTTRRSFTWGNSPSASEFGILLEYDKSGGTDPSPATSSGPKAYTGTEGDVNETTQDDLAEHGDLPPYDNQNFNTRVWVKVATLDNSDAAEPGVAGGHSRMSTGFFNAPCGLVVIKPSLANDSLDGKLSMTVKAGDYKGVAAMNMGA